MANLFILFNAIFLHVILPLMLVVALGAIVQRFYPLHMPTLSRLNIQLFIPAFIFVKVYESQLSVREIAGIAGGVLLPMLVIGLPLFGIMWMRRTAPSSIGAVLVAAVVFNAGNFGIPVAELLYRNSNFMFPGMKTMQDGVAVQALVVMMANLTIWFLGYGILAMSKGHGPAGILGYFKLPMIYVLVAAFLLRWIATNHYHGPGEMLPVWLMQPARWVADGYVPVALVTLGAQLAQRARWPRWRVIGPVMVIKLLALPAATFGVSWALGMWPWPGAQLVIASAAPTAINTLLLTLELDGDADLAADCVFWTTLASAVSVTLVMTAVVSFGKAIH